MSVRHVVERCPSCGVEHEAPGDGTCEACGTPLRAWCRRHGAEFGWLEGPACGRCAEEAARPPTHRPAPAPRVTRPAVPRPRVRPTVTVGRPVPRSGRVPARAARPPPSLMTRVAGGFLSALAVCMFGWMVGVVAGAIYGFRNSAGFTEPAGAGGRTGALVGLLIGVINAVVYIGQSAASVDE